MERGGSHGDQSFYCYSDIDCKLQMPKQWGLLEHERTCTCSHHYKVYATKDIPEIEKILAYF